MLRSLYTAATGMEAQQTQMDVIANNLANSATPGFTASDVDFQSSLAAHGPIALAIVIVATLVILFLMTGSVVLPIKSLIMNALNLSAVFGLLVLIFQDGRLEGLLDYSSPGAIEQTMPILMFAVAFGLSTDYAVFLLSRIKEARDAGASDSECVAIGLERTGRIVTAAAIDCHVHLACPQLMNEAPAHRPRGHRAPAPRVHRAPARPAGRHRRPRRRARRAAQPAVRRPAPGRDRPQARHHAAAARRTAHRRHRPASPGGPPRPGRTPPERPGANRLTGPDPAASRTVAGVSSDYRRSRRRSRPPRPPRRAGRTRRGRCTRG